MNLFEYDETALAEDERLGLPQASRGYFGKYRGTVVNNVDLMGLGRVQVVVPDVSTTAISTWAMPCLPWASKQAGLYTIPQIGDGVWVEFEHGDPDFPIWVGCYWGIGAEVPLNSKSVPANLTGLTLQTQGQYVVQVSDVRGPRGGIQLRDVTGAQITITDLGIRIANGRGASITLIGKTVSINDGALTIT